MGRRTNAGQQWAIRSITVKVRDEPTRLAQAYRFLTLPLATADTCLGYLLHPLGQDERYARPALACISSLVGCASSGSCVELPVKQLHRDTA